MSTSDLLVVAGEASGDLFGARMLSELSGLDPSLRPFGLGGDELAAAGLDELAHSSEISVVGLTEVLSILPKARRIFRALLAEVDRRRPAAAVLIDFPEFNLRLARELHRRGVSVLYYVSPQVWAWRRGRVRSIARLVDKMLVLFPFEVDFYRDHGVDVVHVGHPLVDEVPELPHVLDGGAPGTEPFHIALMPGSRRSEVRELLPPLIETAARISEAATARFSLIQAPSVPDELFDEVRSKRDLELCVVRSDRFATLADCHLALCASGTATLEVGLIGTPLVVVYRVSFGTHLLGRMLVRLPHISLVNLVLQRPAVPERIQRQVNATTLSADAAALLRDGDKIAEQRAHLAALRQSLGESGASARAARAVLEGIERASSSGERP